MKNRTTATPPSSAVLKERRHRGQVSKPLRQASSAGRRKLAAEALARAGAGRLAPGLHLLCSHVVPGFPDLARLLPQAIATPRGSRQVRRQWQQSEHTALRAAGAALEAGPTVQRGPAAGHLLAAVLHWLQGHLLGDVGTHILLRMHITLQSLGAPGRKGLCWPASHAGLAARQPGCCPAFAGTRSSSGSRCSGGGRRRSDSTRPEPGRQAWATHPPGSPPP